MTLITTAFRSIILLSTFMGMCCSSYPLYGMKYLTAAKQALPASYSLIKTVTRPIILQSHLHQQVRFTSQEQSNLIVPATEPLTKTFSIAGPIKEKYHYFVPRRLSFQELDSYVDRMQYFVLHAPRQSGKTTGVEEYVRHLNNNGKYHALYINIEAAQAARDNVEKALVVIVELLAQKVEELLPSQQAVTDKLKKTIAHERITLNLLFNALKTWAEHSPKPIVLFIDEIDSLIGDSLLSVLRQIRAGFNERPSHFPQSLCLIGLRDVRDYRVWSREKGDYVSTSSPFNIKALSLTLANFSLEEVKNLYEQHTQATGQQFTPEATEHAFYLTQGQPWLVNALAQQTCDTVPDRTQSITKQDIENAKEALILRRDTHIDSLVDKLHEPRIRYVIDAILSGSVIKPQFVDDDIQYAIDLGLISSSVNLQIANPIYQEIIPRVLTMKFQKSIVAKSSWYENPDGSLNMTKLLDAFTQFYRENSQAWLEDYDYIESGPHILMMAFMQQIINGGGLIHREYALGKKRVDLLITWKQQKFVIELKIHRGPDTLKDGKKQTLLYMDIAGADEGHLIIFDRDMNKSWDNKISHNIVEPENLHVWTL